MKGVRRYFIFVWLVGFVWFLGHFVQTFAEGAAPESGTSAEFKTVEAEIMEVEELKEPLGSAIYTVKDLVSGQTMRFFVDPHLSLIQSGGQTIAAGEVMGGSKTTIIYRESAGRDIPEIVFATVSGSYY